jgi:hypothetical protein
MGDQFCSLVFTLSNLNLVVCLYVEGFNSNWRNCGSSRYWPLSFFFAILPFLCRVLQSFKRYADSGLNTHLINARFILPLPRRDVDQFCRRVNTEPASLAICVISSGDTKVGHSPHFIHAADD